jgi:hypothetical protein
LTHEVSWETRPGVIVFQMGAEMTPIPSIVEGLAAAIGKREHQGRRQQEER